MFFTKSFLAVASLALIAFAGIAASAPVPDPVAAPSPQESGDPLSAVSGALDIASGALDLVSGSLDIAKSLVPASGK